MRNIASMAHTNEDTTDDVPTYEGLLLGPPFAIADGCTPLERDDAKKIPGCSLTLRCDCGQLFRVPLLKAGTKRCPSCNVEFTHCFLVCRADDDGMVADAMMQIAEANGVRIPNADDGEGDNGLRDAVGDDAQGDDDDEGDDDGQGDDAQGDDDDE
jgi:hypothetical protein